MMLRSLVAGGALALALTASAQAQNLTGADTEEILNFARGLGSASLTEQPNGDPQITGKIDGVTYQIYFRNCASNDNCEDLKFFLGFLDVKPDLEKINEWNLNQRFSRAYLDGDRDACVQMDLDLAKGVSPEYLESQFAIWDLVVEQFTAFAVPSN